jgi:hypothetical protein
MNVPGTVRPERRSLSAVVLVLALAGPACTPPPHRESTVAGLAAEDGFRALIDDVGTAPTAVLVREYVALDGALGRLYATAQPLTDAPTSVTTFYRDRLLARGWSVVGEHAAVSQYTDGPRTVSILRAGPDDPGLPPGARSLVEQPPAGGMSFFFAVEVVSPAPAP